MTTLTDHLRTLSDQQITTLLRRRPDLLMPVPGDLSALAVRAQSRLSVARAVDSLDRFTLEILDALRLARTPGDRTVPLAEVVALASAVPEARVRAAAGGLRDLLLVYGPDQAMHLVAAVDEVCTPYPAGLGRPAAELGAGTARLCADPAALRRTVLEAPPAARAVLDRLSAGPPVGSRAGSGTATATGAPVRWLVEHDLLAPIGDDLVELPREVGLLLRRRTGDGPLGPLHPDPPPLVPASEPVAAATTAAGRAATATPGGEPAIGAVPGERATVPAGGRAARRDPKSVDSAGAGQALEVIRQVEALLESLAADPAPVLRTGGLGVRDLRRLAKAAELPEPLAGLLIEVSGAAGLAGETDPDAPVPGYLPTVSYDRWRAEPLATRWAELAVAWLAMTRQPGLIGRRGEKDRLNAALSPDVERTGAPLVRRAALAVLAGAEAGVAPDPGGVLATLAWQAPRRFPPRPAAGDPGTARIEAVRWALGEAAALGVSALGALTSYGRVLLEKAAADGASDDAADPLGVHSPGRGPAAVARALDDLLPSPVDHLLVQTDLTIVVPGPPEPALAGELELIAERESSGGASVYRVTPDSVRRALDAGYSAADLHRVFAGRSRTPVPQALVYLIDDVARRHGGLRVGAAGCYLRTEDEALLAELVADRRLSGLSLRRLAPTVLVTPYHPSRLLAALRESGYAPAQEDASGAAVVARPRAHRAPARAGTSGRVSLLSGDPLATGPRLTAARLAGIVEHLRSSDEAARTARRAPVTLRAAAHAADAQTHAHALAVLQQAVREKRRVWVSYVDAHGGTVSRLVRPVSIGAGYLRAEDERSETLHTFRLERITAAVEPEG